MKTHSNVKDISQPHLTASSWILFDTKLNKTVAMKNPSHHQEIASLTKIMTALLVTRTCTRLRIDPEQLKLYVSYEATQQTGTTANLLNASCLSVTDLLCGMLLPSGNDAAYCLAENIGALLFYELKGFKSRLSELKQFNFLKESVVIKRCGIKCFIKQMNLLAQQLQMEDSNFSSVNGLSNKYNKSTSSDLLKLAISFLEIQLLRDIVSTKYYQCDALVNGKLFRHQWENTNKLLNCDGYCGIKTGFTNQAGYCLASQFNYTDKWSFNKIEVLVIVLNSDTNDDRYSDTRLLVDWYILKKRTEMEKYQ